jgi:carbonic anhydrase
MRQWTGSDVIADLQHGNLRFRDGRAESPRRDSAHRRASAAGQSPKAAVLTCSDSRVPPELIFDQGLGDLFVVRTAGHVVDRGALGSLEYAVEHLHVPVIVVLGHSGCGAVTAAVAGRGGPGHVDWIVSAIRPAARATAMTGGDAVDNAAREHVRRTVVGLLGQSALLSDAVERRRLAVLGAFYDLSSGTVDIT